MTEISLYGWGDAVLSRTAGLHLALRPAAVAAFRVLGVWKSVDAIVIRFTALHAATGFIVAACAP